MVNVGWATGGGAAQILFSLFGELVFNRGPHGIGIIWGCAGVGLLCGGAFAHWLRPPAVGFDGLQAHHRHLLHVHGGAYILFSQMQQFLAALVFIALSRAGVAFSSVMNYLAPAAQRPRRIPRPRLRHHGVDDLGVMMMSMMGAGIASQSYSPRVIGAWSGVLSSTTAIAWTWLNLTGRLPEPMRPGVEPEEVEVHGEPTV